MKRISIVSTILLTLILFLSSCLFVPSGSKNSEQTSHTELTVPTEQTNSTSIQASERAAFSNVNLLPMQFLISEDQKFVYLLQDIEQQYSKISVADSYDKLDVVYDADEYYIKNIACGDGFTAWTELTDKAYAIKYYDHNSKKTTIIRSGAYDFNTDYQILEIKAYQSFVYFTLNNNAAAYSSIISYDTTTGQEFELRKADFYLPESLTSMQFLSLDLKDGWLLFTEITKAGNFDFQMIDLEDESLWTCYLNEDIRIVYGASFEDESQTLALYYRSIDGKEYIGISKGTSEITNIVGFSSTAVAYRDRIFLHEGNVYYIEQETDYESIDTFQLCEASLDDGEINKYAAAFSFFGATDGISFLAFDSATPFKSVRLLTIAEGQ